MFCTCVKALSGFKVNKCYCAEHEVQSGNNWDLWVCVRCSKPTRMVFEKMTGRLAPRDAISILHVSGKGDGTTEIKWNTKHGDVTTMTYSAYPRKIGMIDQTQHLKTLWDMLDEAMKVVKNPVDDVALSYYKARARALCDTLAVLMAPFYENSDAVAREAMARYKAQQAGTEHDTPGLAETIYDPHTRWDGTAIGGEAKAAPTTTGKKLPDEAIAGVKQALSMKMMTISQLAKIYGVNETEIKKVVE